MAAATAIAFCQAVQARMSLRACPSPGTNQRVFIATYCSKNENDDTFWRLDISWPAYMS